MFRKIFGRSGGKAASSPEDQLNWEAIWAEAARFEPLENPLGPIAVERLALDSNGKFPRSDSWLGGRPRLGNIPWPRDEAGVPIHHAASISLAKLSRHLPSGTVPQEGHLAFFMPFLPEGPHCHRVLHTTGISDSDPPDDLPVYDVSWMGKDPFSDFRVLPRCPVRLTEKPAVRDNPFASSGPRHTELLKIYEVARQEGRLPWYWGAAHKVLYALKSMLFDGQVDTEISSTRRRLESAENSLAENEYPNLRTSREKEVEKYREKLGALENHLDAYRAFVSKFEDHVRPHHRWEKMNKKDVTWLRDTMYKLSEHSDPEMEDRVEKLVEIGAIFRSSHSLYSRFDALHWRTFSAIFEEATPVLADMPTEILDVVNGHSGIVPDQGEHQMFGFGKDIHGSLPLNHHMLLQLEYDDGAKMFLGDVGVANFMILPENLEARRWDKVEFHFACH